MNYFTKQRLLVFMVIPLIILNVATLGVLWSRKGKARKSSRDMHGPRVERYLIRKLDFSEGQKDQFSALRKKHRSNTRGILKEIRTGKKAMFNQMDKADSVEVQEIASGIGDAHARLEVATFHHFRAIREICDEQQKQKFDSLLVKIVSRDRSDGHRRGPPKHK